MRNIIHIVHWEMSGIYGVAKTLQERGSEIGHQHKVVTLRKNKTIVDKIESIFRVFYCVYLMIFTKNTVIHSHSFLPFLLSMFVKRNSAVFTFHNAYPFLKGKDFKSRLKCSILKFIIKSKKPKITAVGKLVAEYVYSGTNSEALAIANGMDISKFQFTPPFKKIKHIGSIGRLDKEKNYSNLIAAISNIDTDLKLEIAGEGVLREQLEQEIDKYAKDNITLPGFKKDILNFHKEIDGFICSSYHEGCNLSFIESILLGNPVISTNVGVAYDFPELEFIRLGNDVLSLKAGIEQWISIPPDELKNSAIKNRELAEQLFNIVHIYEIYQTKIW